MRNFFANDIIERLKEVLNLNKDKDLTELLQIGTNQISTWKNRNTIDFLLIYDFCLKNNIDINYIMTGEGNKHLHENHNLLSEIENLQNEIKKNDVEIQKDAKQIYAYDSDIHKLAVENLILSEKVKLLSNLILQATGKTI